MLPAWHNFERLAIKIEGLPPNASLTRGRNNGDKTWSVDPDDVEGLAYVPASATFPVHKLGIRIIGSDDDIATTITVMEFEVGPDKPPPVFPRHESYDELDEDDAPPASARGNAGTAADVEAILARAEPRLAARIRAALDTAAAQTEEKLTTLQSDLEAEIARRVEETSKVLAKAFDAKLAETDKALKAPKSESLSGDAQTRVSAELTAMVEAAKKELTAETDKRLDALRKDIEHDGGKSADGAAPSGKAGLRLSDVKWQIDQLRTELFDALSEQAAAGGTGTKPAAPRRREDAQRPAVDSKALSAEIEKKLHERLTERLDEIKDEIDGEAERRVADGFKAISAELAKIKPSSDTGKTGGLKLSDIQPRFDELKKELLRTIEEKAGKAAPAASDAKKIGGEIDARVEAARKALAEDAERRVAEARKALDAEIAKLKDRTSATEAKAGGLRQSDVEWQLGALKTELLETVQGRIREIASEMADGARDEVGESLSERIEAVRDELTEAGERQARETREALEPRLGEIAENFEAARAKAEALAESLAALEAQAEDAQGKTDARLEAIQEELAESLSALETRTEEAQGKTEARFEAIGEEVAESARRAVDDKAEEVSQDIEEKLAARIDGVLAERIEDALDPKLAALSDTIQEALGERLDGKAGETAAQLSKTIDEQLAAIRDEWKSQADDHVATVERRLQEMKELAEGNLDSIKETALADVREELREVGNRRLTEDMAGFQRKLDTKADEIEANVLEQARMRVTEIRKIWDSEKKDLLVQACEEAFDRLDSRYPEQKPEWLTALQGSLSTQNTDWDTVLTKRLESVGQQWSSKAAEWVEGVKAANNAEIERRMQEFEARFRVSAASSGAPLPARPITSRKGARALRGELNTHSGPGFGGKMMRYGLGLGVAGAIAAVVFNVEPALYDRAAPYVQAVTNEIATLRGKSGGSGATVPTETAAHTPSGTAVVKAFVANLRSDPSSSAPVVATLARGEEVELLDRIGNWIHLRTASNQHAVGWMHSSLLSVAPPR